MLKTHPRRTSKSRLRYPRAIIFQYSFQWAPCVVDTDQCGCGLQQAAFEASVHCLFLYLLEKFLFVEVDCLQISIRAFFSDLMNDIMWHQLLVIGQSHWTPVALNPNMTRQTVKDDQHVSVSIDLLAQQRTSTTTNQLQSKYRYLFDINTNILLNAQLCVSKAVLHRLYNVVKLLSHSVANRYVHTVQSTKNRLHYFFRWVFCRLDRLYHGQRPRNMLTTYENMGQLNFYIFTID